MPPFPIIAGPTAGGKSALAVEVARQFQRQAGPSPEILSADAFQVYRHMDIGTAKPTPAERQAIPHHLIDLLEPDDPEPFTVHRWLALCERAIAEIRTRRGVPIVAGGTHLYIKALLDGLFDGPDADPELRAQLESMPADDRRAELQRIDPAAAARIHPNDARRTIRALEVHRLTGRPISDLQGQWDREPRADALLVILDWPTEAINRRINARVRDMLDRGLVEEVRELHDTGRLGPQAAQALGYKQILAHLRGECPLDEAIEKIKIETRRFAKNQRTWLRRLGLTPGVLRIDGPATLPDQAAQVIVDACLRQL